MNDKNLIPFNKRTESEQREIARSGGRASGRARGFRAAAKKLVKENPEKIPAVLGAIYDESLSGNIKAAQLFIELCGEGDDEQDKKLKKAQLEKLKADTERIRADTERIQAETELLKRKASDGDDDDGEARAALARALEASAAAAWEDTSDDETGTV